jgi:hypothetical protein
MSKNLTAFKDLAAFRAAWRGDEDAFRKAEEEWAARREEQTREAAAAAHQPTARTRRVPRVVTAPVWMAPEGAAPPRLAAVALRVRGGATRHSAVNSPLGRGAHLRLAWSVATSEQGLRTSAADGRGYDLRRHEPHHAAQAGGGGVKHLHLSGAPDPCLQNSRPLMIWLQSFHYLKRFFSIDN